MLLQLPLPPMVADDMVEEREREREGAVVSICRRRPWSALIFPLLFCCLCWWFVGRLGCENLAISIKAKMAGSCGDNKAIWYVEVSMEKRREE